MKCLKFPPILPFADYLIVSPHLIACRMPISTENHSANRISITLNKTHSNWLRQNIQSVFKKWRAANSAPRPPSAAANPSVWVSLRQRFCEWCGLSLLLNIFVLSLSGVKRARLSIVDVGVSTDAQPYWTRFSQREPKEWKCKFFPFLSLSYTSNRLCVLSITIVHCALRSSVLCRQTKRLRLIILVFLKDCPNYCVHLQCRLNCDFFRGQHFDDPFIFRCIQCSSHASPCSEYMLNTEEQ